MKKYSKLHIFEIEIEMLKNKKNPKINKILKMKKLADR